MVSNGDTVKRPENGNQRDEKGRFVSAAGPGRPKGLAALIQGKTHGGADLVDWYHDVWQDESNPLRHRLEAGQWLTERGFGKVVQPVAPTDPSGENEYHGSTDDQRIAEALAIFDAVRAREVGKASQ